MSVEKARERIKRYWRSSEQHEMLTDDLLYRIIHEYQTYGTFNIVNDDPRIKEILMAETQIDPTPVYEHDISYSKLEAVMFDYNRTHPDRALYADLEAVIVYKESNWKDEYSLEARSYRVHNNCYGFTPGKISSEITGSALDGSDNGVRLDWYHWKVDYCYMVKK